MSITISNLGGMANIVRVMYDGVDGELYNVYSGYSPFFLHRVNAVPLMNSYVYDFPVPYSFELLKPYVQVRRVVGTSEVDLAEIPVTYYNYAMKSYTSPLTGDLYFLDEREIEYYWEENRRRIYSMIDLAGEDFVVFNRIMSGKACTCVTNKLGLDPEMHGQSRHELCFGTGFLGGYYPGIRIKAVFNINKSYLSPEVYGTRPGIDATWDTIWDPEIHVHDIIYCRRTGDMLLVTDVNPGLIFKGMRILQKFKVEVLPPQDIRKLVSTAKIYDIFTTTTSGMPATWMDYFT